MPLCWALGKAAEQRMAYFTAQDLAVIAWALATARPLDVSLLKALATAAEHSVDGFSDHCWVISSLRTLHELLRRPEDQMHRCGRCWQGEQSLAQKASVWMVVA
eukprot:gnl/TRDRNA2_/TRDRNA2_175764_c16_seq2.p2 gnl/TRDRNA2_/TRDRNA2_175764_c16~~gnl/TRDRNA2_/TRDRNA2_175764_c16_seq2.p2  ORF type:complete len:104 (+),score=20.35 gnl/TRDRNA2_/TRDRNA2_175764_c16_seq2:50-361(+)